MSSNERSLGEDGPRHRIDQPLRAADRECASAPGLPDPGLRPMRPGAVPGVDRQAWVVQQQRLVGNQVVSRQIAAHHQIQRLEFKFASKQYNTEDPESYRQLLLWIDGIATSALIERVRTRYLEQLAGDPKTNSERMVLDRITQRCQELTAPDQGEPKTDAPKTDASTSKPGAVNAPPQGAPLHGSVAPAAAIIRGLDIEPVGDAREAVLLLPVLLEQIPELGSASAQLLGCLSVARIHQLHERYGGSLAQTCVAIAYDNYDGPIRDTVANEVRELYFQHYDALDKVKLPADLSSLQLLCDGLLPTAPPPPKMSGPSKRPEAEPMWDPMGKHPISVADLNTFAAFMFSRSLRLHKDVAGWEAHNALGAFSSMLHADAEQCPSDRKESAAQLIEIVDLALEMAEVLRPIADNTALPDKPEALAQVVGQASSLILGRVLKFPPSGGIALMPIRIKLRQEDAIGHGAHQIYMSIARSGKLAELRMFDRGGADLNKLSPGIHDPSAKKSSDFLVQAEWEAFQSSAEAMIRSIYTTAATGCTSAQLRQVLLQYGSVAASSNPQQSKQRGYACTVSSMTAFLSHAQRQQYSLEKARMRAYIVDALVRTKGNPDRAFTLLNIQKQIGHIVQKPRLSAEARGLYLLMLEKIERGLG